MANWQHFSILKSGVKAWNEWRVRNKYAEADLSSLSEIEAYAIPYDLSKANFYRTSFSNSILREHKFDGSLMREADFTGATLLNCSFKKAILTGAVLDHADLRGANLTGADLTKSSLVEAVFGLEVDSEDFDLDDLGLTHLGYVPRRVYLSPTSFCKASLAGARMSNVVIINTQNADDIIKYTEGYIYELSEANTEEEVDEVHERYELNTLGAYDRMAVSADFSDCDLSDADMSGLQSLNENTCLDFRRSNMIRSVLDNAVIAKARFWQAQTGGWSIKKIKCSGAWWDADCEELIIYEEGDFERIFADKPRIKVHYPKGMSAVDLAMLPLIVQRLQAQHPDCALHIRSLEDAGMGAVVIITVVDLADRDAETFRCEIEKLRGSLRTFQQRLVHEERLRLQFEARYNGLVSDVVPQLLDRVALKHEINVGQLTGPIVVEGNTMSRDTYNIHGAGAVGPNAHVHDMIFQQVWSQSRLDLPELAQELARLRIAMETEGTANETIDAVVAAEKAATQGDGPTVLRHLKAAGKWALGVAEKIGVAVAAEAIKRAMAGPA